MAISPVSTSPVSAPMLKAQPVFYSGLIAVAVGVLLRDGEDDRAVRGIVFRLSRSSL